MFFVPFDYRHHIGICAPPPPWYSGKVVIISLMLSDTAYDCTTWTEIRKLKFNAEKSKVHFDALLPSTISQVCFSGTHTTDNISMVTSTKVLCPQNLFSRKLQRYKCCMSCCGHMTFMLSTPPLAIFCNDVDKTSTSVELLAINILRYFVIKK